MKKITLLFLFSAILGFTAKAQTMNCGSFCILNITIDTVGANTLDVTIYNGDTVFVNYPSVVVVNGVGDTIGNINNDFFFFGQLSGDTVMHSIPTSLDSLGSPFSCTVYFNDNISFQSCSYSYPMSCTVGINELATPNNVLSVFPNPASSEINISVGDLHNQKAIINMYNEMGQLVKSVSTKNKITTFNREDLTSGIYFITVDIGNTRLKNKLLIQ